MKVKIALLGAVILIPISVAGWWSSQRTSLMEYVAPTTGATALEELHRGNQRYVQSHRTLSVDTSHDAEWRMKTAKGQHPFVAVVTCSDSRICPEFVFDQRVGSIFEIRNAGNVVDDDVLATLEYSVEHFHIPLIVIMGHKGCGAIDAVCAAGATPLHDHLRELQQRMKGIHQEVIECHHRHDPDTVNRLARENAKQQAKTVMTDSPVVAAAVRHGETRLVYALYDLESGIVEFNDLDIR